MGINVDTTISLTFMLGGLMAGAAGLIYALYQTDGGTSRASTPACSRSPRRSWAASATSGAPSSAA